MPPRHRRTATRVRDGRVQKKNNWKVDHRNLSAVEPRQVEIVRRAPGEGYRHVVTVSDVRTFLDLLPDWEELAIGLRGILLGTDDDTDDCMGWYGPPGLIGICAWEHDLWWDVVEETWLDEHGPVLDLINVERRLLSPEEEQELLGRFASRFSDRSYELRWTAEQARAFQLLHILPHELGHHHDRITTSGARRPQRGESYAETYANRVLDDVWPAYARTFAV